MERKVAILDLGTNTFHLVLANLSKEQFSIFYKEKKAVMLGKGGINNQLITGEAELRAMTTLHEFKDIIDNNGITEVITIATSAFRNARNAPLLIKKIKDELGFDINVINGREEAEYIYKGVKSALTFGETPSLIMDIGGGSCEFIIASDQEVHWMCSYEIGAQRLMDRFMKSDPIAVEDINKIRDYLKVELGSLIDAMEQFNTRTLIGASGSFDTLNDIYKSAQGLSLNGQPTESDLPIEEFFQIQKDLFAFNHERRLKIPGMIPMRADMIVISSILIQFVISHYKFNSIRISSYALKEGILSDLVSN